MKTCSTCKTQQPLDNFQLDKSKKDGRKYRCKKCCYATQKKYELTDAGKARNKRSWWKRAYGISPEQYEKMYAEQKGICWICKRRFRSLCVDHCHATGKVRGLLCKLCNTGIGMFKDNEMFLDNAISYLRQF